MINTLLNADPDTYEGMGYLVTKVPYDYHHRYDLYLKKLVSPMRDISTPEKT